MFAVFEYLSLSFYQYLGCFVGFKLLYIFGLLSKFLQNFIILVLFCGLNNFLWVFLEFVMYSVTQFCCFLGV
jgi:hypothetical protein